MENKNWKILAIIFICISIIEMLIFISLINVGLDLENKEIDCIVMCDNNDKCISYSFDIYTEVCSINGIDDYGNSYIIKSKRML